MKRKYSNIKSTLLVLSLCAMICGSSFLTACSDDFLAQDPLSFFEPGKTFTTESGLSAALSTSDKLMRDFYNNGRFTTDLLFSDLGVFGTTTDNVLSADLDIRLTPTTLTGSTWSVWWFWDQGYGGVKYANTVISNIDNVTNLDEKIKNAYLGRAYFHRSWNYLMLVFNFGDIPLVTKLIDVPKENYQSTKKEAILNMITKDMEFAVEWVPDQKDMTSIGMVNKGACRQLLIKCYLATGQFQKAKEQADILIEQSGFELMKNNFGSFISSGEPETWPVTRNVIWDLHRPENKLITTNKEVLLGAVNRGTGSSFMAFNTMRAFGPFWNDGKLQDPQGKQAVRNWARNNANYDKKQDWLRAIGRGIADVRPTYYATTSVWHLNGSMDVGDLRHDNSVGNWFSMDNLTYNDPTSQSYGKTFAEIPATCPDTIRAYFDFPLYKLYLKDQLNEDNPASTNFQGASLGSVADWYIYRLAETYLLRAEANYYLGDPVSAAKDVNEVRKRAQCSILYPEDATFTIGDIMDERTRELYLEEFRHAELSRVSYCLALSGKPDEWGNTYDVNTYDKQDGLDANGGSYWYQRVIHYNNFYIQGNQGIGVDSKNTSGVFYFKINKRNLFWPIPNDAITKNSKAELAQNYGYDGYNPNTFRWNTWEEAVEDEDKVK